MDGYEKIFRKSEGGILYAQEGSNHKTTWAEVVGYGEVYWYARTYILRPAVGLTDKQVQEIERNDGLTNADLEAK